MKQTKKKVIKDVNDICIQCGQSRQAIKKEELICGTLSYEGELMDEWEKHRFKPYPDKELARMKVDEEAYVKQMGEFADFVEREQALSIPPPLT